MCCTPVTWVVRLDAGAAQGMGSRLITKTCLWMCRRYSSEILPHPSCLLSGLEECLADMPGRKFPEYSALMGNFKRRSQLGAGNPKINLIDRNLVFNNTI